jgi:DNA polymerase (family 10)
LSWRAAAVAARGCGDTCVVENARIADRLDTFAALLELRDANPYTVRAYRGAAATIRGAAVPVAELVRAGRVRELRGIAPGIEARLRELVETGTIAELVALERELAPDLVGLGRYLGLGAKRSIELARALDVRTADELREAAAAGRLRAVPGIGAKTEARLLEALAREGEPRLTQGLLINRGRELVGGATRARGWRSSAPRRTRGRCWPASPSCRRSSPWSKRTRAARSA